MTQTIKTYGDCKREAKKKLYSGTVAFNNWLYSKDSFEERLNYSIYSAVNQCQKRR